MDTDGSNQTNLTNDPDRDGFPSWSPDGKKIAFHSKRDGNYEIYTMDADGSNQTRITYNAGVVQPSEDEGRERFQPGSWDQYPSWSPDGTRIAFTSDRDGNDEIYIMNADGANQTRITSNPDVDASPSWGPGG